MDIAAIVQARMGATRLPGKVMKIVCGKTLLEHLILRLRAARALSDIIVATTAESADSVVAAEAERCGVKTFRGSELDVLSRYYEAARQYNVNHVVRITADCPLLDYHLLDDMIERYAALSRDTRSVDYLSNTLKRTFPRGLDIEIFRIEALARAHGEARRPPEREHVTLFIYNHPEIFRLENYAQDQDHSHLRWTVDTPEDFDFVSRVYEALYPENPLFDRFDVLRLLERQPELVKINAQIRQKEA